MDIPSVSPTARETMTNDKNELNLSTSMRKSKRQIPRITMIRGIKKILKVTGYWILVADC
jgi:hypothetical protein